MITRDQFEAHVRAEAKKEHPLASAVGSMLSSRAIHRLEEFDDKAELRREAYIAARMEHEWPLVEALQDIIPIAQRMQAACDDGDVLNFDNEFDMADAVDYHSRLVKAQAALSPYTTKPIS